MSAAGVGVATDASSGQPFEDHYAQLEQLYCAVQIIESDERHAPAGTVKVHFDTPLSRKVRLADPDRTITCEMTQAEALFSAVEAVEALVELVKAKKLTLGMLETVCDNLNRLLGSLGVPMKRLLYNIKEAHVAADFPGPILGVFERFNSNVESLTRLYEAFDELKSPESLSLQAKRKSKHAAQKALAAKEDRLLDKAELLHALMELHLNHYTSSINAVRLAFTDAPSLEAAAAALSTKLPDGLLDSLKLDFGEGLDITPIQLSNVLCFRDCTEMLWNIMADLVPDDDGQDDACCDALALKYYPKLIQYLKQFDLRGQDILPLWLADLNEALGEAKVRQIEKPLAPPVEPAAELEALREAAVEQERKQQAEMAKFKKMLEDKQLETESLKAKMAEQAEQLEQVNSALLEKTKSYESLQLLHRALQVQSRTRGTDLDSARRALAVAQSQVKNLQAAVPERNAVGALNQRLSRQIEGLKARLSLKQQECETLKARLESSLDPGQWALSGDPDGIFDPDSLFPQPPVEVVSEEGLASTASNVGSAAPVVSSTPIAAMLAVSTEAVAKSGVEAAVPSGDSDGGNPDGARKKQRTDALATEPSRYDDDLFAPA